MTSGLESMLIFFNGPDAHLEIRLAQLSGVAIFQMYLQSLITNMMKSWLSTKWLSIVVSNLGIVSYLYTQIDLAEFGSLTEILVGLQRGIFSGPLPPA